MKALQLLTVWLLLILGACVSDTREATPPASLPPAETTTPTPPRVDDQTPELTDLDLSNRQVVAGEIKDFGDRDIKSEGRQQGEVDARGEHLGFMTISPCEVIKPSDLQNWPGGLGKVSSQRNNVADIVLGCIYTFEPTASTQGGRISVYFSDNQTPEQANDSVQAFGQQAGGRAITDWTRPASYSTTTGDFVWARGRGFVTLLIEHPAIGQDRLEWTQKVASAIDARIK